MGLSKLLKKGVISITLLSTLSYGCALFQRRERVPIEKGEKYAVLCTGASIRDKSEGLIDPIDKNCFWISAVNVYNELLEGGYKPENIYVLYQDGKPPFDDEEYLDKIKEIKKEFDGSYSNIATRSRLEELLNGIETKIKPEDKFVLYLNMHGSSLGEIHFEHDGSYMNGDRLEEVLKGNQSKKILILADTCHAESFTEDIDYPSILISASKKDFYGWGDRKFSCGSYFFEEMNNKKNDTDKDGKVSAHEAFVTTKERCIKYREEIDEFLRNDYEGDGIPDYDLKHMDLIPIYREVEVKKEDKIKVESENDLWKRYREYIPK